MENTTPGPLKNNLTSTPYMNRKSLFNAPDVSPIRTGRSTKSSSGTSIVSKIPVKLTSRKLLTKIPSLSGQIKTSEPEKPVLRTIDNNDQADATGKNEGEKIIKSPKVSAAKKEASSSKNVSSSSTNKKNGADNLSNMDWEAMEVLSHEVLDPVSKKGSNLDIDLNDDDDDGDFEMTKKGKKNQSNSKKCPSQKKDKQAESKGAEKKPAKSARGKKKADPVDNESVLENTPEETKINSKMQLDGETANKVAENRRVLKKAPNKDPNKPPARNKRKAADIDLEPVVKELNDAEVAEKKVVSRNKRKTVVGDLEPVAEEPMDVEDEPKSPVRNKSPFHILPVTEEPEKVEDQENRPSNVKKNGTFDLGPVTDKPKIVEDENKTRYQNKRKSSDFDKKVEEPVEGQKKRTTRNMKKTLDLSASAPEPIVEIKPADAEMEEESAQTRKMARVKKMRADKKENKCASEPSVEVREEDKGEEVCCSEEKAIEVCEPEPAPKKKRNGKNQEDVKEISAAFSEMGEKEDKNVDAKEPEPKSKTETTVKKLRNQKATALDEIPFNPQPSTSSDSSEAVVETKRSRRKVAATEENPVPGSESNKTSKSEAVKDSGSSPVIKKDVKFDSFNAPGGKRLIPLNRIFGNPFITDTGVSPTSVKAFKSLKPSENVMGGFISIPPNSSHNGLSTNYNLYFLMSNTQLKVNIMGFEKKIENQLTSFFVPKDCRFSIENVGSGAAILSFTKLRSI